MVYSGSYPFLINEVINVISKIRDNNKTAKISFLISSNTMRRGLKEYISDRLEILYNTEFFTKIDLAKKLTGIDPINDLQKEVILEKILKDKNFYIEGIEKEYSQLIQKIKENLIKEDILKENKKLYEIFKDYENFLNKYNIKDREDIIIDASQEIFETDFLFIFGFQTLTEIDKKFFKNLIEKNKPFIFIPIDLESGVLKTSPELNSIFSFFKGFKFKTKKENPSTKNQLISRKLFSKKILKEGINSENLYFFNSQGRRKEIEKICKEILKIRKSQTEWYRIGVIINDTENYLNIIKEIFEKYKIPYYLSEENRYIDEIGFKKLYFLLTLKENNFKKDRFLNSLSSEIIDLESIYIDEIERKLVNTGFEEGFEQLIKLIDNQNLRELLRVIKDFPNNSHIFDYCSVYLSFIENHLKNNEFTKKLKEILKIIKENTIFSELYNEIDLQTFNKLVLHFLEEENVQNRLKGNIVEIRTPTIAAGLLFDYLFFIDMNEGKFPSSIKENPILDDNLRMKLEKVGFPKLDSSYWQQILTFLSIFNSGKNVYLLFKDKDEKGNDLSPSILFEEVLKYQYGELYFKDDIAFQKETEMYILKEFIINNSKYLINSFPTLKNLVEANKKRESIYLSEYEGKIRILNNLKNLSPSKLQTYSDCPYKFFVKNILEIDIIEIPDKERIPADKEGSIIHKILENIYKKYVINKTPNVEKIKNYIEKQFDTSFEPLIQNLKPSSQIFERNRILKIKNNIIKFVEWDLDRLKNEKLKPEILEAKRGVFINGFSFKGKIDRADKDVNGYYYIYDYKTGIQKVYDLEKSLKKGDFLQLIIYKKFLENEGKKVKEIGLFFVKESEYQRKKSIIINNNLEADLETNLNVFLNLIKDGYFTPFYKSESCSYCEFTDFCEKFTNEYLEEKSKKDDKFVEFLNIKS